MSLLALWYSIVTANRGFGPRKTNPFKTLSKGNRQSIQWKKIFVGAFHDFSPKYQPNLVFLVIGLLVAPGVGLLMNTPKGIIYSCAAGVTLLIWLFAFYLVRQTSPPRVPETELHGLLVPANDLAPPTRCPPGPPDALNVFFGSSVSWATMFPLRVVNIGGENLLVVNKTADGLAVSAKIFSEDTRIVAEIIDNEFHINPNNYFRRDRPDKHTLIVFDQRGRQVFNIRFLNPSTIKVSGIFYYPSSRPVIIADDHTTLPNGGVISGTCHSGSTGIIGP